MNEEYNDKNGYYDFEGVYYNYNNSKDYQSDYYCAEYHFSVDFNDRSNRSSAASQA